MQDFNNTNATNATFAATTDCNFSAVLIDPKTMAIVMTTTTASALEMWHLTGCRNHVVTLTDSMTDAKNKVRAATADMKRQTRNMNVADMNLEELDRDLARLLKLKTTDERLERIAEVSAAMMTAPRFETTTCTIEN